MREGYFTGPRKRRGVSRRAICCGFGPALLGVSGCTLKEEGYRYRLSIEVEVGGRRYVGQGVRELIAREVIGLPNAWTVYHTETLGDAIWIEAPGAPTLFILLRQAIYGTGDAWDPTPFLGRGKIGFYERFVDVPLLGPVRGRVAIPLTDLPTIVVFDDVADKSTMRLVLPGEVASVLGSGARIVGAWIERTSDPVTRGIEAKLPCLAPLLADPNVRGRQVTVPGELTFNVPDFRRSPLG